MTVAADFVARDDDIAQLLGFLTRGAQFEGMAGVTVRLHTRESDLPYD